jgi:hypothetical protein
MSAIPAAIDKLVLMMGLVGPKVVDGPPVGVWQDEDCIIVGWQRDAGASTEVNAGVRVEHAEGFVTTDEERFAVACMVSVVGGDMALRPLRERAVGFYEEVTAAIRQDPTLLGAVAQAQVSSASIAQYFVQESGGVVDISFDVSCIAFL